MGRALLIICLGSFIILGIIQQSVHNRQFTMTEGNIETFMVSHGRNLTGSALEMTINRIIYDSDWDKETFPQDLIYNLENMDIDVQVNNHVSDPSLETNFIRVSSSLQLDNRNITSQAFLRTVPLELPETLGALAVYGPRSDITFSGNNLNVIGFDTNPGDTYPSNDLRRGLVTTGTGDAEDLSAIVTNEISKEDLVDGTNLEQHTHYSGAEPAYDDQNALDDTRLLELIEEYESMGSTYDGTLGDSLNPKVTLINEASTDFDESKREVRLDGDMYGSGILIIDENVTLTIVGTVRFDGLVIVKGNLTIRGTIDIYGGAIMTDNSTVEEIEDTTFDPSFEASGRPSIYYSSKALENIQNRLVSGSGAVIVSRILY